MTTNQTIDGVPRELLLDIEYWLKHMEAEKGVEGRCMALKELRALLDKTDADIPASTQKVVPLKLLIDLSKPLTEDADLHTRIRARNELRGLLGDEGAWVASAPSVPCEQHIRVISGPDQPSPAAPTPINYGALDPVERLAVCRGEQVRMCDCNQGRMPCNGKCAPASTS